MRFAQLAGATIVPAPPFAIRLRYEQSRAVITVARMDS